MHATTLERPLPAAATTRTTPTGGTARSWRPVGLLLGVLLVLVGGAWSMTAERAAPPLGPGQLRVDDGAAQVEQVVSAARPQHAMPGMGTDDDPVAEGERRVSVELTLLAADDDVLAYDVDDFRLTVQGAGSRSPQRSVLPGDELPAGTALSGTLVFDVPVDAATGALSYGGAAPLTVTLPPEVGAAPQATATSPDEHGAEHG